MPNKLTVADWSINQNTNDNVGGVPLLENETRLSDTNDAPRHIMAQAKVKFDAVDAAHIQGLEDVNDALEQVAGDLVAVAAAAAAAAASVSLYVYNNVAGMQAATGLAVGKFMITLGYVTPGDGGGNTYKAVALGTGTVDEGSFIALTGSPTVQAMGIFPRVVVNAAQFGIFPHVSTDWTTRVAALFAYADDVEFNSNVVDPALPTAAVPYIIQTIGVFTGNKTCRAIGGRALFKRTTLSALGGVNLRNAASGGVKNVEFSDIDYLFESPSKSTFTAAVGDAGSRVIPFAGNTITSLFDIILIKNGVRLNVTGTTTTFNGVSITLAAALPAHIAGDVYHIIENRGVSFSGAFVSSGIAASWNEDVRFIRCRALGLWYYGHSVGFTRKYRNIDGEAIGSSNRGMYTEQAMDDFEFIRSRVDGKSLPGQLSPGVPVTFYNFQGNVQATYEHTRGYYGNPLSIDPFLHGFSYAGTMGQNMVVDNLKVVGAVTHALLVEEKTAETTQGERIIFNNVDLSGGTQPILCTAPAKISGIVRKSNSSTLAAVTMTGSTIFSPGSTRDEGSEIDIQIGMPGVSGQIVGPGCVLTNNNKISGKIRVYDCINIACQIQTSDDINLDVMSVVGTNAVNANGVNRGSLTVNSRNATSTGVSLLSVTGLTMSLSIINAASDALYFNQNCVNNFAAGIFDSVSVGVRFDNSGSPARDNVVHGVASGGSVANAVLNDFTAVPANNNKFTGHERVH